MLGGAHVPKMQIKPVFAGKWRSVVLIGWGGRGGWKCCVFRPALECYAHSKAGQLFYVVRIFSLFSSFFVFSDFFVWKEENDRHFLGIFSCVTIIFTTFIWESQYLTVILHRVQKRQSTRAAHIYKNKYFDNLSGAHSTKKLVEIHNILGCGWGGGD